MVMCTKALSPSLWSVMYVCQIGEEQYSEQFLLLRVLSICINALFELMFYGLNVNTFHLVKKQNSIDPFIG